MKYYANNKTITNKQKQSNKYTYIHTNNPQTNQTQTNNKQNKTNKINPFPVTSWSENHHLSVDVMEI